MLDRYFDDYNHSMYESLGERYSDVPSYYPWRTAHAMFASRICAKIPLPCNKKYCFKGMS